MNVRRHARISEGAYQDGVEISPQHGETILRDGRAILQVLFRTPAKMREFQRCSCGLDHAHSLGNHLAPNTVPGDHRNASFPAHGKVR